MGDEHRQELRTCEVQESYCVEPGCEFNGERAVQGVCHSSKPDLADWDRLHDAGERFADELRKIRTEHYTDKDEYIEWLEAMYECAMLNWTFTLDECIRLRREVALLKRRLP